MKIKTPVSKKHENVKNECFALMAIPARQMGIGQRYFSSKQIMYLAINPESFENLASLMKTVCNFELYIIQDGEWSKNKSFKFYSKLYSLGQFFMLINVV